MARLHFPIFFPLLLSRQNSYYNNFMLSVKKHYRMWWVVLGAMLGRRWDGWPLDAHVKYITYFHKVAHSMFFVCS